jgi:hypothetical protein
MPCPGFAAKSGNPDAKPLIPAEKCRRASLFLFHGKKKKEGKKGSLKICKDRKANLYCAGFGADFRR